MLLPVIGTNYISKLNNYLNNISDFHLRRIIHYKFIVIAIIFFFVTHTYNSANRNNYTVVKHKPLAYIWLLLSTSLHAVESFY